MDSISLNDKKSKILLLEKEIKQLEQKKKQLKRLKLDYYHEYFDAKRDDFALLTDIPSNPNNRNYRTDKHVLYDYSVLNIDTVGKIICELIKKYDREDCVAKRVMEYAWWENKFGDYLVELPRLVIGKEDSVEKLDKDSQNIIIEYSDYCYLKDYPTKNPVTWKTSEYGGYYKRSNYNNLVGYYDGLDFEYHNREYIRELIYSLAYYQKQHDIKQMPPSDTWDVYRKIYYKK